MARPYWSGQVQISLVSFGVKLFPRNRSANGRANSAPECNGERKLVERSDIVKAYEYGKGEYVVLEPKELKKLRIPTQRAIEIRQFVNQDESDFE